MTFSISSCCYEFLIGSHYIILREPVNKLIGNNSCQQLADGWKRLKLGFLLKYNLNDGNQKSPFSLAVLADDQQPLSKLSYRIEETD